jgi:hypothetical protein
VSGALERRGTRKYFEKRLGVKELVEFLAANDAQHWNELMTMTVAFIVLKAFGK